MDTWYKMYTINWLWVCKQCLRIVTQKIFIADWKHWTPIEVANWSTFLGTTKNSALESLLITLIKWSVIKPLSNQYCKNTLGFNFNELSKMHKNIQLNLSWYSGSGLDHAKAFWHFKENTDRVLLSTFNRSLLNEFY